MRAHCLSSKNAHPKESAPNKGTQNRWVLLILWIVQPFNSYLVQWPTDNKSRSLALVLETEKSEYTRPFREKDEPMFSISHGDCYHWALLYASTYLALRTFYSLSLILKLNLRCLVMKGIVCWEWLLMTQLHIKAFCSCFTDSRWQLA